MDTAKAGHIAILSAHGSPETEGGIPWEVWTVTITYDDEVPVVNLDGECVGSFDTADREALEDVSQADVSDALEAAGWELDIDTALEIDPDRPLDPILPREWPYFWVKPATDYDSADEVEPRN